MNLHLCHSGNYSGFPQSWPFQRLVILGQSCHPHLRRGGPHLNPQSMPFGELSGVILRWRISDLKSGHDAWSSLKWLGILPRGISGNRDAYSRGVTDTNKSEPISSGLVRSVCTLHLCLSSSHQINFPFLLYSPLITWCSFVPRYSLFRSRLFLLGIIKTWHCLTLLCANDFHILFFHVSLVSCFSPVPSKTGMSVDNFTKITLVGQVLPIDSKRLGICSSFFHYLAPQFYPKLVGNAVHSALISQNAINTRISHASRLLDLSICATSLHINLTHWTDIMRSW